MRYTRTMKDGTKKTYYSEEEVSNYIKKNIRFSANELKKEILLDEKKDSKKFNFINREVAYV